ncbi:MAG: hypothetical protein IKU43_07450 [Clostridia bacterium]|nr:hypothetical protein [Clostridia bacterium]
MKKILAMLIAAAAMVGVMGVTAMAADIAVTDEAELVAALTNAEKGDTINVTGEFALTSNELVIADGVTLNAPGVSGEIYSAPGAAITVNAEKLYLIAGGDLEFKGANKLNGFSLSYYNNTLNIGNGASLEITGTGRVTVGYGNSFIIKGSIDDASIAENVTPSLVIPGGLSITGNGATFDVEDAYISLGLSTSKNSGATNVFDFSFENSIVDFSNNFSFTTPTGGKTPTFNITFEDSVINLAKNFDLSHTDCNVVIDNSDVTVGSSFRNDGKFDVVNGSKFNVAAQIQPGEHGGNIGVITVDDSRFEIHCSAAGHAVDSKNTGVIIAKNNAVVDIDYIKDTAIAKLDDTVTLNIEAVANTNVETVEAPVALVGGKFYADIKDAFKAVTAENNKVEILSDVTFEGNWDCRNYGSTACYGKFSVPVVINGNGNTIKLVGTINDNNHDAFFRFEDTAVVNDLTIDMSGVAGDNMFRAISAKTDITIDNCNFIGNGTTANSRAVIFGEGAGTAISDVDVTITGSTFDGWRRGITDNENAQNAKSVVITGNEFENANVAVSASETVVFTDNEFNDEVSTVSITKYGNAGETAFNTLTISGNDANEIVLRNYTTKTKNSDIDDDVIYTYSSEAMLKALYDSLPTDTTVYVGTKEYIVDEDGNISTSETVELVFVPNTTYDDKALANTYWDIVLVADEEGIINRLNSADFTFVLETVDADDDMAYEIIATNEEIVINNVDNSDNRYEFHYDGKTGTLTDTDTEILLGMVKFTGYGPFTFKVVENETNAVHATTLVDNVVDTYTVNAGNLIINTDKDEADDGVIESEILVPTKDLTINVDFPNSVNNNVIAYQAMKVTVSGGDLANDIVIKLGNDAVVTDIVEDEKPEAKYSTKFANGAYVVTVTKALTINTSYNVTVEGAGYRTARYTVTMTEDKILNFWNNVKDNDTLVEEKKDSSAKKVTFLAGDIVKDSLINIYDLSAVVSYFGESMEVDAESDYAKYDLNRDGKIDSKDVAYVLVSWGK